MSELICSSLLTVSMFVISVCSTTYLSYYNNGFEHSHITLYNLILTLCVLNWVSFFTFMTTNLKVFKLLLFIIYSSISLASMIMFLDIDTSLFPNIEKLLLVEFFGDAFIIFVACCYNCLINQQQIDF